MMKSIGPSIHFDLNGMALVRMDLSGGDTGQSQCASSRLHLIHLIIEQADHTNRILAQHCLRFN